MAIDVSEGYFNSTAI